MSTDLLTGFPAITLKAFKLTGGILFWKSLSSSSRSSIKKDVALCHQDKRFNLSCWREKRGALLISLFSPELCVLPLVYCTCQGKLQLTCYKINTSQVVMSLHVEKDDWKRLAGSYWFPASQALKTEEAPSSLPPFLFYPSAHSHRRGLLYIWARCRGREREREVERDRKGVV